MLKKLLFIIIVLYTTNYNAQEELLFSTDDITRIFKIDNFLYYGIGDTSSLNFPDGSIHFIDLNDPSFTPQLLTGSLNNPIGMDYKDGHLYVAEAGSNKIIKLDLSQTNPMPIDVFQIGVRPNDLLFVGDILYFSVPNSNVIASYDTTSSGAVPVAVFSTPAPFGIEFKDGFMYVSNTLIDAIYRKNIMDENSELELVIDDITESNLDHPLNIEFFGNDLYIASRNSDKIFKVDVSSPPFVAEEILSFNGVSDLLINDDYLYYCNTAFIYRIELASLSIDEFSILKPKLYPNPVEDVLNVSNIKSSQIYEIYDATGRKIKQGVFNQNDNKILMNNLSSGFYVINFKEINHTFKFFKQ
ncbi:T9SS type A sorting domain-containing protein [Psychroserpens mesophilus]|uniref:T9SS type A sorting domain-containing protein n=1 Tax=Psychroserpens mesophilus TaxID=325473 RepID=UPI00059169C3|nr:T9SS type A sorting domain-containing protein [Psychroserpens mesophilus]